MVSGFNVVFGGGRLALNFSGRVCYHSLYEIVVFIIFLGSDLYSLLFYVRTSFVFFLFVCVGVFQKHNSDVTPQKKIQCKVSVITSKPV